MNAPSDFERRLAHFYSCQAHGGLDAQEQADALATLSEAVAALKEKDAKIESLLPGARAWELVEQHKMFVAPEPNLDGFAATIPPGGHTGHGPTPIAAVLAAAGEKV